MDGAGTDDIAEFCLLTQLAPIRAGSFQGLRYCNMFNGLTNEKMHKNARRDHKSIQRPLKGPRHKSHKLLEVKHMTGH